MPFVKAESKFSIALKNLKHLKSGYTDASLDPCLARCVYCDVNGNISVNTVTFHLYVRGVYRAGPVPYNVERIDQIYLIRSSFTSLVINIFSKKKKEEKRQFNTFSSHIIQTEDNSVPIFQPRKNVMDNQGHKGQPTKMVIVTLLLSVSLTTVFYYLFVN